MEVKKKEIWHADRNPGHMCGQYGDYKAAKEYSKRIKRFYELGSEGREKLRKEKEGSEK